MSRPDIIHKTQADFRVSPNLVDYASVHNTFSWEEAQQALTATPDGGRNIAYEAVERHARGERRDHAAFRFWG